MATSRIVIFSAAEMAWTSALAVVAGFFAITHDWEGSQLTARVFAAGIALAVSMSLIRDARSFVSVRTMFWLGFFYTVLIGPIAGLNPEYANSGAAMATSLWLCTVFAVFVQVGAYAGARVSRKEEAPVRVPAFSANSALGVVWVLLVLEFVRRMYFVDWNLGGLVHDTLKARSGDVRFGRGMFGDWRVVLEPISIVFTWLPCFTAFHWSKERRLPLRIMSLLPALVSLAAQFFGGSRGAFATPILAFLLFGLLQADRARARRYILAGILISLFVSPLMDLMVKYRNVGWGKGVAVTQVVGNPLTAKHDANFEALSHLVDVVPNIQKFGNPAELYFYVLTAPIPRFLWPTKPYMSQDELGEARQYYASVSIIGDLYFYGGVIHVVLGGIVFGWFLPKLEKMRFLGRFNSEAAMIYIFSLVAMLWTLRALWGLMTAVVVIISVLAFMYLMGLAMPVRASARTSASRRNNQDMAALAR